jgi:hypothetical protein
MILSSPQYEIADDLLPRISAPISYNTKRGSVFPRGSLDRRILHTRDAALQIGRVSEAFHEILIQTAADSIGQRKTE